jgi:FkbM family methyltransferase
MSWIKKKIKFLVYTIFPRLARKQIYTRYNLFFTNNLKDQEFEVLPHIINNQSVVLDIGANLGEYSYFFQEIIRAKKIIAFEPIPDLFKRLKLLFPSIEAYKYAVSNQSTKSNLYIPFIASKKYETRAKLDILPENGETHVDKIQVETISLDVLFAEISFKIDFIKIDIEGHELQAIRGAKKLIKRDLPVLMIEIEFRHHPNDFYSVIEEICALGYICTFYDKSLKSMLEISQFSLEKQQNLSLKENYYIHNFLFFPIEFNLEKLNNSLKYSL